MKELNINIGSEYLINHCRKGKFFGILRSFDSEWFVFVVSRGKAGAMLAYNEKDIGEEVVVRRTLCSLTEVQLPNPSHPLQRGHQRSVTAIQSTRSLKIQVKQWKSNSGACGACHCMTNMSTH